MRMSISLPSTKLKTVLVKRVARPLARNLKLSFKTARVTGTSELLLRHILREKEAESNDK